MSRIIREADLAEVTEIMHIMDAAKGIMRQSGNMHQWGDGYPSEAVITADIERNKYRLENVDLNSHLVKAGVPKCTVDTVILGCTHYFFIKNQFIDHFCPRKILSGEKFTSARLKNYLHKNGLIGKSESFTVDFIGENSEENFIFYNSVVKNIIFSK